MRTIFEWICAAILSVCLVSWPAQAYSMQRLSQEGCYMVADVVITARALARANISKDASLPILTDMYEVNMHPLMGEVLDASHLESEQRTAKEFAQAFATSCLQNGGDTSKFFGDKV